MPYSLLPVSLHRKVHTSMRLEMHSLADLAVVRFAMTETIDRRGERPIREYGWQAPAMTFLSYAEMYTALRDHWDLEMGSLDLAERKLNLAWEENPRWRFSRYEGRGDAQMASRLP